MFICDHKVVHEDVHITGNESNRCLLELKESLFIKKDKSSPNENLQVFIHQFLVSCKKIISELFLSHRTDGVNLKMEVVPSKILFKYVEKN